MKQSKQRDLLLAGAAFALFVLVSCHRLTMSALWFDEAIEYWYSKVMFGPLPFSQTANMYERIVSTLQPPLYNILLWFWLRVSDTEWWFRFFGVVAGLVGMAGLHRTVERYTGKSWLASVVVCGAAFVYRMAFYWQEAAEYCLLLASLFWTVYYWFRLLETPSRKHTALFLLWSVIPVYSQYGAAFPVAALALTAVFAVPGTRQKLELCAGGAAALVCAGLPLWFCFLKKQLPMQRGGSFAGNAISFDGGFLKDSFDSLLKVFRWNLVPDYSGMSARILLILALLFSVAVLIWGRRTARAFVIANALTWLFYYFAVKLGVYADMSYGGFGNRYNLFFLPLWIPYAAVLLWEGLRILSEEPFLEKRGVPAFLLGAAVCFVAASCVISWNTRLSKNWVKDDIREAVYRWYDAGGPGETTLVYYAANGGFAYYVRMTPGYAADTEDRVTYMDWYEGRSGEEYRAYFDKLYGADWPRTLYIVSDHHNADLNTMLDEFRAAGYDVEELYNYDEGARLLRLRAMGD
ncbi:MAG: glycosyltransferase family 39 protein [Oscillibacter sp.]|nr:glycosyltransferase family 39 protein [Oscillibacter sp.]